MSDGIDPVLLAERLDHVIDRLDDLRDSVRTYAPTAQQVAVIQYELTDVRDDIKQLQGDVQKLEDSRNSSAKLIATTFITAVIAYAGARLTGHS